jgi:hypothetical protein
MPDVDTASPMEPDPSVVAEPLLDAPRLGVIPGLIWAYRILEDGRPARLRSINRSTTPVRAGCGCISI